MQVEKRRFRNCLPLVPIALLTKKKIVKKTPAGKAEAFA
jgi:hypothetical protein